MATSKTHTGRKGAASRGPALVRPIPILIAGGVAIAATLGMHAFSPTRASAGAEDIAKASWNIDELTRDDLAKLRGLWLGALPPLPPDPTNRYADDPRAADFGHRLFFDTRLSSNGKVACATCHDPRLAFTDGRKLAAGVGQTARNAPTVIAAAYNRWFFWDGRKDSQWSQALASLENPLEHNMPRDKVVAVLRADPDYAARYRQIFGPLPPPGDKSGIARAFVNTGKAIAAYQRKLLPAPAKFDRYVEALLNRRKPAPEDRLSLDESEGLRVFLSDQRGRCLQCHNGPLFTNQSFHNIGVPLSEPAGKARGRAAGAPAVLNDEFNCRSAYSDASSGDSRSPGGAGDKTKRSHPGACATLRFVRTRGADLVGAFKTPTLRFLTKSGPYMHNGGLRALEDVTWHYRTSPIASIGRTELEPFTITDTEFLQIEAFLRTLDGPLAAPDRYQRPPGRIGRAGLR